MLLQSVHVCVALVLTFSILGSIAQYSAGLLPLLRDMSICDVPPGNEHICTLAGCCSSWVKNAAGSVQISSTVCIM